MNCQFCQKECFRTIYYHECSSCNVEFYTHSEDKSGIQYNYPNDKQIEVISTFPGSTYIYFTNRSSSLKLNKSFDLPPAEMLEKIKKLLPFV